MSNIPLIRVPEFILHTHVENLINFVRLDYADNIADLTQSFLYKLCHNQVFQRYNYFEQAKDIFVNRTIGDPKYLEVDLMFNTSRDTPPMIHVTCPSETPGQNGLGNDAGYLGNESYIGADTYTYSSEIYTRRYKGTYDLVIVSDNSNECVAIYHILKALLVSTLTQLSILGLENVQINGNDLTPYAELMPKTMYMRTLRLNLEYESSTLSILKDLYPQDISFSGTPKLELP